MDCLQTQVISEHYRLIQQLENKYMERINTLLRQKSLVHLALQQTLYNKLLEIQKKSSQAKRQKQNINNINNILNFDQMNDSNDPYKDIIVPNRLLFQQFNQTNIHLQKQKQVKPHNSSNQHNNSTTTDSTNNTDVSVNKVQSNNTINSKQFKCNICNISFDTQENFTFHQSIHSLQVAIINQFPENYVNMQKNKRITAKLSGKTQADITVNNANIIASHAAPNNRKRNHIHINAPAVVQQQKQQPQQQPQQQQHDMNGINDRNIKKSNDIINGNDIQEDNTGTVIKSEKMEDNTGTADIGQISMNFANFINYGKTQRWMNNKLMADSFNVLSMNNPTVGGGPYKYIFSSKKWKCPLCDKRFSTKNNMKQHQIIHDRRKDFKCDKCSFATAHKRSLIRHKAMHIQNKPYGCNVCFKKVNSVPMLESHIKSHQ